MKSGTILLMSVTLIAASCGPLSQQPQGTPRYADAVYAAPQTPIRTVSIYSKEDFERLAAEAPKPMPDSLDLESDGYTTTYVWTNPYYYSYTPWMYSYGNPWRWYGRGYMGSFWGPYDDWAYSYYWDWYSPWGYDPWYYDSWGWNRMYPHGNYYGGAGYMKPGMREPDSRNHYYGPRSLVQGSGRSDSGTRLPGGKPGYNGVSVTRTGTSAVGATPRSEMRSPASGTSRSGSAVTTERGYAPNSTGNYSRGGSSYSSGSSVTRSGSSYRSSDSGSVSRSSSSFGGSSSSGGGYSGGGSSGGGGGSSHSGGSSGGGGGGRR